MLVVWCYWHLLTLTFSVFWGRAGTFHKLVGSREGFAANEIENGIKKLI